MRCSRRALRAASSSRPTTAGRATRSSRSAASSSRRSRRSSRTASTPGSATRRGTTSGWCSRSSNDLAVPEVMRAGKRAVDVILVRDPARKRAERLELANEDVLVPVDLLEAAASQDQRLAADERSVAVVHLRRDDQVHLTEFVLDQ